MKMIMNMIDQGNRNDPEIEIAIHQGGITMEMKNGELWMIDAVKEEGPMEDRMLTREDHMVRIVNRKMMT
jgi:hypothetical protein